MTPERWQQIRDVLAEALEITPAKRAAFLDGACSSDDSLRQEVESLLSSSNNIRSTFLQAAPPPTEQRMAEVVDSATRMFLSAYRAK